MARPPSRLILAIALAVVLLHWATLGWLARQWQATAALKPFATPLYTRLLAPATPAAAPKPPAAARAAPHPFSKPNRAVALVPSASSAIDSVAESSPDATATATTPMADAAPLPAAPASLPVAATATATVAATASTPSATASTASFAEAWPRDTRLRYQLRGNYRGELHGDAQVQWQHQGTRYEVRIDIGIGMLASLVMTSQGDITPQGLFPRGYQEETRAHRRTIVLGDTGLTLEGGQNPPRPPALQDTASQFVELSQRFASGQNPLTVGTSVVFPMARPNSVDEWTYDIAGRETLSLPRLGPVEAFHLKPRPLARPKGSIVAEMWYAPSLQYLPVRIRITLDESNYVDLLVEQIEQK